MMNTDEVRIKFLAQLNADFLVVASSTYASESIFNPNPFNYLFGRNEPFSFWGICNVQRGFQELMKHELTEADRSDMVEMLLTTFREKYGDENDPLSSVGASIFNWPLQYAPRSRECLRIADYILHRYS